MPWWHEATWEAWPKKDDRLKRWMVVSTFGDGRGKTVIADNIREEEVARHIASCGPVPKP